ncbi:TetR family transcriptional regulator [Brevibacterium aurantiacum]|uniref:TetR family transcriptional regulator n=1 Tax=Brevibacterium aurantiacum TaxID=273384 RepID=A0A556C466_BREAU|nr:TetR family transcriptional regulator [Brevibacterium aurantiacum]
MIDRLREAIAGAGINHSEVARKIGIEPSKLSKSLAGTRKFRVEEISAIATLTNVTADWLTTGRSARPPLRGAIGQMHHEPSDSAVLTDMVPPPPPVESGEWMSKGTRNRRRIVSAAWELYADRGIDNVRAEDVAAACGLSASAVNYHFRTKPQLLQAALRYSLETIAGVRDLNEPSDPVATLRHFARVHAGVDITVRRVWSIWIQSWARAESDDQTKRNLTAVYSEWLDMITGVVAAGQSQGTIRTGNTSLMVKALSVFIDGLGVARSTQHMPITDEEALSMLDEYLDAHILTGTHPQEEGT